MTRRRLGQHFLYDPAILKRIVEAAGLQQEDTVVEIGPGPGRLTRMLAEEVKRVIAIEVDQRLFERLTEELAGYGNIELIHADALKFPYDTLSLFKVVANIPYYITTPILFRLLEERSRLTSATVMVQKEIAERIVAGPGGKEYGVLSLMVQYYSSPAVKFFVPRGAFRPVPKVDSALIHLEIREEPAVTVRDERLFFRVIKTAFSQRRKMLSNALASLSPDVSGFLMRSGIDPSRRAETLSIEDFARLSDLLRRGRPDPGDDPAS
ncbi:MAG TPA: 16S rRNA (adenine(1518)-N(6)/adenine(1519)-N(6))-dimethyltransferase RsmA [Thermodesulfovibrionales bacterium]|nr:16S rRNA (adenine(1518)-N(6)/adenine(1519)-N(6))-dimethyltransferase RsmA [Thermodesulfovibrionales bacterium]